MESAPKSDVWTDTYRTGPSEDAQARLDAEWNAAVEAAAKALEAQAVECWGGDSVTCVMMRGVYADEAMRIRALKRRGVALPTPDTEGLWDIIRELKERPCEHGNDCRPKVEYMHPCLPCAARIEWEAK